MVRVLANESRLRGRGCHVILNNYYYENVQLFYPCTETTFSVKFFAQLTNGDNLIDLIYMNTRFGDVISCKWHSAGRWLTLGEGYVHEAPPWCCRLHFVCKLYWLRKALINPSQHGVFKIIFTQWVSVRFLFIVAGHVLQAFVCIQ